MLTGCLYAPAQILGLACDGLGMAPMGVCKEFMGWYTSCEPGFIWLLHTGHMASL